MIACYRRYGRLANRLFTFSNLIAFSELYRVPVMVPAFADYRRSFPFFDTSAVCSYGITKSTASTSVESLSVFLLSRIGLIPTVRFWEQRYVYFDEEDRDDARVQTMIRAPRVVFEGWDFCSRRAILQFRERIRSVFSPRPSLRDTIMTRTGSLREKAEVLVGVHIRWGDYRGTDRYFDIPEYVQYMSDVAGLLSPSKVAFALFSAEAIPLEAFPDNSFICSSEDPVQDLYFLAECDYLIGPPSTFSMWASYYGGRPLFMMRAGQRVTEMSMANVAHP
jgi:hypothetical protein